MKRLVTLLLALAMIFSLAACSKAPASAEEETKTDASASESQTPTTEEKTDAESTTTGTVTTIVGEQATKQPAENTIRIGVLSYLSDAKAETAHYFQIGWEAGAKLLQEKGMLNGYDVEFVVYDPGNDGAMLQQRFSELVDMGCVALLHSCGDALTPTSSQWSAVNKVPVISSPNANTKVTIENFSDYFWNCGTKGAWSVGKLCAIDAVSRGYTSFSYVGKDGAACQDAITFLQWEGQKLNPDFHIVDDYRVSDGDFTAVVSAVMSSHPDMVLEQGAGATFVSFMQAAQQFDLPAEIPVYDDFAADSSTGGPMVKSGTFPWGQIHGVVQLAYWLPEYVTGDIERYTELANASEYAQSIEYFAPVQGLSTFYSTSTLLRAVAACMESGADYNDHEVLNKAISEVNWEDSMGEHFFRDFDHCLTNTLFFGTADTLNEETGTPICSDIKAYTWEEQMPSKADYREYCESIGFDHQGRFDD